MAHPTSQQNVLRKINESVVALQALSKRLLEERNCLPSDCPTPVFPVPSLELPEPQSLLPVLRHNGNPSIARHFSEIYERYAKDLQQHSEGFFSTALDKIMRQSPDFPPALIDQVSQHYRQIYETQLQSWETLTLSLWHNKDSKHENQSTSRSFSTQTSHDRRPFNPSYTSFLIRYFNINAYPSAADKAELAQTTGMSLRQIDVWFQNHRNRKRKEGFQIGRGDPALASSHIHHRPPLPSTNLSSERALPCGFTAASQSHPTYPAPSEEGCIILTPVSPPHAFPTLFPPVCDYDPFPTPVRIFAPLVWRRTPAVGPITRSDPDMKQLIIDFHQKLRIQESPSRQFKRKSTWKPAERTTISPKNLNQLSQPWFASTCTRMLSAPHFALVRPQASFDSPCEVKAKPPPNRTRRPVQNQRSQLTTTCGTGAPFSVWQAANHTSPQRLLVTRSPPYSSRRVLHPYQSRSSRRSSSCSSSSSDSSAPQTPKSHSLEIAEVSVVSDYDNTDHDLLPFFTNSGKQRQGFVRRSPSHDIPKLR